jgi:hypothetical protein
MAEPAKATRRDTGYDHAACMMCGWDWRLDSDEEIAKLWMGFGAAERKRIDETKGEL